MVKFIALAIAMRACAQNASGTSSGAVFVSPAWNSADRSSGFRFGAIASQAGLVNWNSTFKNQAIQTKPHRVKQVLTTFGIRLACQVACVSSWSCGLVVSISTVSDVSAQGLAWPRSFEGSWRTFATVPGPAPDGSFIDPCVDMQKLLRSCLRNVAIGGPKFMFWYVLIFEG